MIGWKLSKLYPCNLARFLIRFLFVSRGWPYLSSWQKLRSKGLGLGHPTMIISFYTLSYFIASVSVVDPPLPESSTSTAQYGWKINSLFPLPDFRCIRGRPSEDLAIAKPEVFQLSRQDIAGLSSVKSFRSRAVPAVPQGWNLHILHARVVWCAPALCWAMIHYRS